jgi:hypothetical protein
VRMHQRHQRQETVVADAQNAHLAIGLGNVLDQPVDAVVGVRRFVHRRGILRPVNRAVHHVVALRAVLAANVLNHANVAAFHNHVRSVVIAIQSPPQVRAGGVAGQLIGAVRRARQQDRARAWRPWAPGPPYAASRRRASGSSPRAARSRSSAWRASAWPASHWDSWDTAA